MSTLLIELAGAQQAWGSRSRFTVRATELAPTRSGVIGLLAAALGLPRTASLTRFDGLGFGVRSDQPGRLERDFQTTRAADGTAFPLSTRFYLADAVFLVGLESSDEPELRAFRSALARPYFPLFLGRRAFPPTGPIPTELVDAPLNEALATAPWRAREHHRRRADDPAGVEIIRDAEPGDPPGETRRDIPVSFDPRRREHDWRDVTVSTIAVANPDSRARGRTASPGTTTGILGSPTDHDPETLLSDEEV